MAQTFETDSGFGDAIGLVVLSTDETMEPELASVFSDDAPPLGTEQPAGALPIGHLGWFGSGQMARPFEEATAVRPRSAAICVHGLAM